MKKMYAVTLSLAFAASLASAANAATHKHHHHVVAASKASSTDWPGNPGFDLTTTQRDAFFRDAFNPMGAK